MRFLVTDGALLIVELPRPFLMQFRSFHAHQTSSLVSQWLGIYAHEALLMTDVTPI